MANPTSVRQALLNAPVGTQWYKPASPGVPVAYLTKLSNGKWQARARGGDPVTFTEFDAAIRFYNQNSLTLSNNTNWQVDTATAKAKKIASTQTASASSSPKPSDQKQAEASQQQPKPEPVVNEESSTLPDGTGPDIVVTAPARKQQDPTYDDWRVRLSLAPGSTYLYNSTSPGILGPLHKTRGVIFPYTPQIQVQYAASYEPTQIVHSNYKVQQYTGSSVDSVTVTGDFTAQDVFEAQYLLAVIHFFRTVTKMWYGQDTSPIAGTPPPLCYLTGLGGYQFNNHPLAVTSFTYNLPNDCDYIKTLAPSPAGTPQPTPQSTSNERLGDKLGKGGVAPAVNFQAYGNPDQVTYVPTKIQLVIGCVPVMSRHTVSKEFDLESYATGDLLLGNRNDFKGIW